MRRKMGSFTPLTPTHQANTMTPQTTAASKNQLLAMRSSLLDQLASLRGGPIGRVEASAAHFGPKEDSTAQEATAREIELALDDHETVELGLVDAALRRIEAGTYGLCIDCGAAIPPARLNALPHAARCIACQEKIE